jgi:predicted MFS family arabinose efflux permease
MSLATGSTAIPATQGRTLSLVAVIASAFISTLTFAVTTPLLAVRLAAAGLSGGWIGLNTGAGAAAILLVSMVTPWLGRRLGGFRALMLSILVMALGVGLLPVCDGLTGWFLLRILIGAGIGVHWVISEVWVNNVAVEADRGKVVGIYVGSIGLAYLAASPILLVIGTAGNLPFIVVTVMIATAAIPILLARHLVPALPAAPAGGMLAAINRQPMVMAASLVSGVAIATVLSFLLLYVQRTGVAENAALLMLFAVAGGNVLLQVPIGMLADRVSADRLLIAVSVVALAGLALMPVLQPMGMLRWPFLFVWGGSLGGFYTLSLTLVGRRFSRDELPGANAAFVIVYEIGGMLGPMASGLGFDLWSPHGALVPLALAYAVFVAGALIVRDKGRAQAPKA